MNRIKHLGKHAKRLWACEQGAVAPLIGVCIIMLIGAVAVAVDIGRGQVAQSKLQASLDSAGLAAGSMVGQNLDEDLLEPEAEKYLNANFQGSTIDATITNFDLDLSEDETIVTLAAEATLPTTFMRIFGKNQMHVSARSEITREMTGLEVALVLDVTGSMNDPVGNGDLLL
jgi:Flp pilus assembly protein TadG